MLISQKNARQRVNISLYRVQSVLQIGENQKSILFFYPKLWNFKTVKILNPKEHNSEKMPIKEKYFQKYSQKYLKNLTEECEKQIF